MWSFSVRKWNRIFVAGRKEKVVGRILVPIFHLGRMLTPVFLPIHPTLRTPISGLPDAASIQAASWVKPDNDRTVLIDASTAFRTADDWDYGFPGK